MTVYQEVLQGKGEAGKVEPIVGRARRRLPLLIAVVLLALGAGWAGGMWAMRLSTSEGRSPIPAGAPSTPAEDGATSGAYLGIRTETVQQGEVWGLKIVEVFPGSPAAKAGLRSDRDPAPDYVRQAGGETGHIIVRANAEALRSEEELAQLLAHSAPGRMVKVLVTSADGVAYEVIPVTLEAAPGAALESEGAAESRGMEPTLPGHPAGRRLEDAIVQAVNGVRTRRGLTPLQPDTYLQRVARRHSADMATRHFVGHRNPDGEDVVDRLRAAGIEEFTAVTENIFSGTPMADLASVVVREWVNSPGHRKNLLNPRYNAAGVGVARGAGATLYITQVYLER